MTTEYAFHSIESIEGVRRAALKDRASLESYLVDLAVLHVLARRAEAELLPDDPGLRDAARLARDRVLAYGIIDAEIERRAPVTEATLREFYDQNPQFFQPSPRVRVRQIVVPTLAQATQIAEQLDAGADFAALAREHSIHPSARRGGESGWIEIERLQPALRDAFAELEAGQRTAPTTTPFGVHVAELQEREVPDLVPFDSVRDLVEQRMRSVRRQEISEQLVAETRAGMAIELVQERIDALEQKLREHGIALGSPGPIPGG